MKWATRARPHVDRCGTAWLIRRFIDAKAEFVFVPPGGDAPKDAEPFDMPNVRLGHRGRDCTFETVMKEHKLDKDAGILGVAALVHDLDLHEMKLPESAGLDAILKGLKMAEPDDHKVLEKSVVVFDSLYARASGSTP
jgi:hypothetical protein